MTIIKRYSNRKLYNTAQKKYITLDELASLIRSGEEIQVIDNQSGEDLTTLTLTQIILESEKKHQSGLPNSILTHIIKTSADELKVISEFLSPPSNLMQYLGDQLNHLILSKQDFDDLSSQIDDLSEKLDNITGKLKK
jgi:polyhydroxyalkanoate synthesis repressor PhaR